MTKKLITFLALFSLSTFALGGRIDDLFNEGLLGTRWEDSIEKVKESYPDAVLSELGGIYILETEDGRKVLGVDRSPDNKITFSFNPDRKLNGISVYFEKNARERLLVKLEELFGVYEIKYTSTGFVTIWPADNGIVLTLSVSVTGFNTDVIFSVGRVIPSTEENKSSLGLD